MASRFQGTWLRVLILGQLKHLDKRKKNVWRFVFYLRIFVTIWNVGYWLWRTSLQQKLASFVIAVWRYMYVKIAFLFFLSIYLRVWLPASWAAQHTTVYLDTPPDISYVVSRYKVCSYIPVSLDAPAKGSIGQITYVCNTYFLHFAAIRVTMLQYQTTLCNCSLALASWSY